MNRTRTVLLTMLLVVPALAGCNGSDAVSGPVERVPVPENVCELVPDDIVSSWDLQEESHSTDNGLISLGICTMTVGSSSTAILVLRIISYSGSDELSAHTSASEDRQETCAKLSDNFASEGIVKQDASSCTVTATVDGMSSAIAVTEVPEAYGVVRVEMRVPKKDGDRVEKAGADVLAAAVAGAVAGAAA